MPLKSELIAFFVLAPVEPNVHDAKNKAISKKARNANKNTYLLFVENFRPYEFCDVFIAFTPSVVWFIVE